MKNEFVVLDEVKLPPQKRHKQIDDIIDQIFQVLAGQPARSVAEIHQRLLKQGLRLSEEKLRGVISHLRKHADFYQWTIPHVRGGRPTDTDRYHVILVTKDQDFYTDPAFKGHLLGGTSSIVKRVASESKNQSMMLRAAAQANHISKNLRAELNEMAEELDSTSRKAKRVLRYVKTQTETANG
jgi:hypothetical protein